MDRAGEAPAEFRAACSCGCDVGRAHRRDRDSAGDYPRTQDAKALANAVNSFTDRLSSASDALGEYSDLANNLPLTDLAPGDPDALDLTNLLNDKLGGLASPHEHAARSLTTIEAKDDESGDLKIQFGNAGDLTDPPSRPTSPP